MPDIDTFLVGLKCISTIEIMQKTLHITYVCKAYTVVYL